MTTNNKQLEFSEKQLEYILNAKRLINIKVGATRCGKTHLDISYTIASRIIERRGKKGLAFILGVSKGTIERNVLEPMREFWGEKLIGFINSENTAVIFGEKVYCLGTEKASQVAKLRGAEAKYIYWDEICEANEEVFELAKSRLSLEYSIMDATGNPKDQNHFIKKFIDKQGLDVYVQNWTIFDNPFLPKRFVNELCKLYQGTIFYNRYILGEWCRAEGAIYRIFNDKTKNFLIDEIPNDLTAVRVGIDFGGNKSAHAFVAVGYSNHFKDVIAFDEEIIKEALTPNDLTNAYVKFAQRVYNKYRHPFETYFDNAEPVLARGIAEAVVKYQIPTILKGALKISILDRIRLTTTLMGTYRLKIMKKCTTLIKALQDAVWDDKAKGDVRLDNNTYCVDILDAFEYCIERDMKVLMHITQ